MKQRCFVLPLLTLTTVILLGQVANAAAGQLVHVQLSSGRHFTAAVDVQSDEQTLWLRFESGATRVWRPVRWSSVVSVRAEGGELTRGQVLALSSQAEPLVRRRQVEMSGAGSMADRADALLDAGAPVRSVDF